MEYVHPSAWNAGHTASGGVRKTAAWILAACIFSPSLFAQAPQQISPETAAQLVMQPQPPVDNSHPADISATAEFDPPAVRPGEKTIYRVTINATQNSILWPDEISLPPELRPGSAAHGQLTQPDGTPFRPLTEFIYEVTPTEAGRMVISNFNVAVGWQRVEIPVAALVVSDTIAASASLRKLILEISGTNLFVGQPVHMRVLLPAGPRNQIEAVRDVQFNGGGFMTDKIATSQAIGVVTNNGERTTAYVYETTATPMAAGVQSVSVQGFTVPPMAVGTITITAGGGPITLGSPAQPPVLLLSDPVQLRIRPVPEENALPGFTGAMGKFSSDPPQLATNRLRVGEPVHLNLNFHGVDGLARFVPPPTPRSRDWQIFADNPPATGFTFIPLTDEAVATPAIPFSSFDPATGKFVDLTIPALPVTVVGEGLPVQLPADGGLKSTAPLKLAGLAESDGKTVSSLDPPQLRGWLVAVQLVPVIGILALWQWDRRRRFLEAHPDIVRRRAAKRALRRKKINLQKAVAAGDAGAFAHCAADALRLAVAPHFPANPQALVCGDVLAKLDGAEQNGLAGETVRKIFAAADMRFARTANGEAGLLALDASVQAVLQKLEGKL